MGSRYAQCSGKSPKTWPNCNADVEKIYHFWGLNTHYIIKLRLTTMLHREGFISLIVALVLLTTLNGVVYMLIPSLLSPALMLSAILFGLVLQFFRNPSRIIPQLDSSLVYAPADGKVVVIEEAEEPEYFQGKRLQVSIFMSPLNVHVNRNPIDGEVRYVKHHPGKYLVAWHPKSSTENERTTVVLANAKGEILLRQIAGAMAKRIVNYLSVGQQVAQGSEMGFIKFGSRVDIFLPLNAKVKVDLNQVVKGNLSVIAQLK